MILISHRGNTNGLAPDLENSPDYIDRAIEHGYDVEMDVRWIDGKLYLGHDEPQYEVTLEWLWDRRKSLWVHTKNYEALCRLIVTDLRIFYHQKENHTIINGCNLIWSHELSEADGRSIIPLLSEEDINRQPVPTNVYGICSDFVDLLRTR